MTKRYKTFHSCVKQHVNNTMHEQERITLKHPKNKNFPLNCAKHHI